MLSVSMFCGITGTLAYAAGFKVVGGVLLVAFVLTIATLERWSL